MAGKGKKGGKGKRGKKGKKEKKPKEMSEVTKAMFEITVKDLTEKLEYCRNASNELNEKNSELSSKYTQQTLDLGDVIAYLKLQLGERADRLQELRERLSGVEALRTQETGSLQAELNAVNIERAKREQELQNEVEMVNIRLNSLEEFRRMRDRFFDEKYALEQQLESERVEAGQKLHLVDRQRAMDMFALRQEAEQKIVNVAEAYQAATRQRIHNTTVRAIKQNVCLGEEVERLTQRAHSAERRFETCHTRLQQTGIENSIQKQLEEKLLNKQLKQQKELENIRSRCGQQLTEMEMKVRQLDRTCENFRCENQQLCQRLKQLEQSEQQLLESTRSYKHASDQLGQRLRQEQQVRGHLEQLLLRAGMVVSETVTVPAEQYCHEMRGGLLKQLADILSEANTVFTHDDAGSYS